MYLDVHMEGFMFSNITTFKGFMPSNRSCLIHFYGNILTLKYVI